jgi:hypothetical protein
MWGEAIKVFMPKGSDLSEVWPNHLLEFDEGSDRKNFIY